MRPAARAMVVAGLIALYGLTAVTPAPAHARSLPSGFYDEDRLRDTCRTRPRSDSRRVAVSSWRTKQGLIYVFDSLEDPTPTVFADLRKQVYDQGDRGILGLELDPNFEVNHHVYVLYTFNHVIGEQAPGAYPRWFDSEHPEPGRRGPLPETRRRRCRRLPGQRPAGATYGGRRRRPRGRRRSRRRRSGGEETSWSKAGASSSPRTGSGTLSSVPKVTSYVSGGDGASFHLGPLRPARNDVANPCGDPPGGLRVETDHLPSYRGRRLPAGPNPCDLVTQAQSFASTRKPGRGWRATRSPEEKGHETHTRPPDRRRGLPQPVSLHLRPRTDKRPLHRQRRPCGSKEINRSRSRPAPAYNSGSPRYEGPTSVPAFKGLGSRRLCEGLYGEEEAGEASTSTALLPTAHGQSVCRPNDKARSPPARRSVVFRPSTRAKNSRRNTKAPSSSPTRCVDASG